MQHIFLKGAVTALLFLLLTSLALGDAPVPNLINFQGRLTDASGNPVADGSHTVNFTLWTNSVGGVNVFAENTIQFTSGGLFTYLLGSTVSLSPGMLQFYNPLYLQIVVDGQTITPRIRLTSTPYSHVAGGLEAEGFDPNKASVKTFAHGLQIFGAADTLQQIILNANLTGDTSAVFFPDAINAGEMLNEPGIAHSFNSGEVILVSTAQATDTVVITAPTSGYVVITAHGSARTTHVNGITDHAYISISNYPNILSNDGVELEWDQNNPTATLSGNLVPFSVTSVTSVSAGTHTFYLTPQAYSGITYISYRHLTAQFFPTAYGTVENPPLANTPANISDSKPGGNESYSKVETITVEEHNARLQAEVDKLKAEMNLRLAEIEKQLKQAKTIKKDDQ